MCFVRFLRNCALYVLYLYETIPYSTCCNNFLRHRTCVEGKSWLENLRYMILDLNEGWWIPGWRQEMITFLNPITHEFREIFPFPCHPLKRPMNEQRAIVGHFSAQHGEFLTLTAFLRYLHLFRFI